MRLVTIIISFLTIPCSGCTLTNDRIQKHWWKYGNGFHLGDVLRFANNSLRNDTIFINNRPTAKIIDKTYGLFGDDNEIVIKSLLTAETGTYHEK